MFIDITYYSHHDQIFWVESLSILGGMPHVILFVTY